MTIDSFIVTKKNRNLTKNIKNVIDKLSEKYELSLVGELPNGGMTDSCEINLNFKFKYKKGDEAIVNTVLTYQELNFNTPEEKEEELNDLRDTVGYSRPRKEERKRHNEILEEILKEDFAYVMFSVFPDDDQSYLLFELFQIELMRELKAVGNLYGVVDDEHYYNESCMCNYENVATIIGKQLHILYKGNFEAFDNYSNMEPTSKWLDSKEEAEKRKKEKEAKKLAEQKALEPKYFVYDHSKEKEKLTFQEMIKDNLGLIITIVLIFVFSIALVFLLKLII